MAFPFARTRTTYKTPSHSQSALFRRWNKLSEFLARFTPSSSFCRRTPSRPTVRRKLIFEALEPRLLLSADILPLAPPDLFWDQMPDGAADVLLLDEAPTTSAILTGAKQLADQVEDVRAEVVR